MGLRPGKLKASVMERSVLRQLHKKEAASVEGREGPFCVHTVEGRTLAARRAVWGAAGKLIAAGGTPGRAALSILLPESAEEADLKKLAREIGAEASSFGLEIDSCTARVSSNVADLVLTLSCIDAGPDGQSPPDAGDLPGGTCSADEGQKDWAFLDLVVAGPVAQEGTALIAIEQRERLLTRYPAFFIDEAAEIYDSLAYKTWMEDKLKADPDFGQNPYAQCQYLGEGGVFAGLWELAAGAGVGLEVELSLIPIRQHTIEVCEFFDRNPYQLFSGGSLLIACQNGGRLVRTLESRGLEAAVIGHTNHGNDRIIRYGEGEIRYLEPPKTDEYYFTTEEK